MDLQLVYENTGQTALVFLFWKSFVEPQCARFFFHQPNFIHLTLQTRVPKMFLSQETVSQFIVLEKRTALRCFVVLLWEENDRLLWQQRKVLAVSAALGAGHLGATFDKDQLQGKWTTVFTAEVESKKWRKYNDNKWHKLCERDWPQSLYGSSDLYDMTVIGCAALRIDAGCWCYWSSSVIGQAKVELLWSFQDQLIHCGEEVSVKWHDL